MLSILVCHSYFLRFDQKQLERAKPYPPLATLQVAALLREAGHQVTLFDAMLASGTEDYERLLQASRPQLVLFYEDNFNFLSKMCLGKMRDACFEMITGACSLGARVIAAGSDATDAPEPYLRAGADLVLLGEGLDTLMAVVPRLEADPTHPAARWVEGLAGLSTLVDGSARTVRGSGPPRPFKQTVPPAWDLVDIDRYRRVWREAHGYFSLNMASSKGCSFRCTWCAKPIWGNQYVQRSAREVAAEMTHLKYSHAPDHVWFADDIFGFRVDWVMDFTQAVRASGGSIPFTIQTRADLISERMAHALRDAGCKEAWIGAESGSQRILDAMNKGTNVAEILTARARLQAVGIRVGFFIQLGYLDEELTDVLATRRLIDNARPDDIGVSVSYPLPGTKFHELVKEQLRGKTHWRESDDLDMMFRGTYTSDFYRAVRNLLHDQVTLDQRPIGRDSREYVSAWRLLESRWNELIGHEHRYRSVLGPAAAAG
ncbi:MAG: Fe-S oxidoreductase [Gammaproteobacteria bacterium]|nr:Fe-S oxidoreductase [Gammaproteobacteria bacterium]